MLGKPRYIGIIIMNCDPNFFQKQKREKKEMCRFLCPDKWVLYVIGS